jgi:PAS domain S-box-containing protein
MGVTRNPNDSIDGCKASQLVVTDLGGRGKSDAEFRLLTAALEQMAEGIALADLDGRLLFSNRCFAMMHGYRPEELVGKHVAVLYPSGELLTLAASDRQTLQAGVFSGELVHCRKDGTSFPAFTTSSLIRDNLGSSVGTVMTVHDISETKISEEVVGYIHEQSSHRVSDLEKQLLETAKDLEDSQTKQKNYTTLLEERSEALKQVIGEIESRNREREAAIYRNLSTSVLPIIDHLKSERLPDSVRLLLTSLEFNLRSLFSPLAKAFFQRATVLTPHEMRLCELIRSGLTSKQMADVMGISPATVVVHRANIRKKLGLVGSGDNLATYLRSMLQSTQR